MFILSFNFFVFSEKKSEDFNNKMGLMFNVEFMDLIQNSGDGVITGFGMKAWLSENLAIRGLTLFNLYNDTALNQTTINFGFSLAGEYHFIDGIVSPYAGALAGIYILSDASGIGADYHLGCLFGVEIKPADMLSFYAEYSLTATFREVGIEVDLGKNHSPVIGVIVYFN